MTNARDHAQRAFELLDPGECRQVAHDLLVELLKDPKRRMMLAKHPMVVAALSQEGCIEAVERHEPDGTTRYRLGHADRAGGLVDLIRAAEKEASMRKG